MKVTWLLLNLLLSWPFCCESPMRIQRPRPRKLDAQMIASPQSQEETVQHSQYIDLGNQPKTRFLCLAGHILQQVCQHNWEIDPHRELTRFDSSRQPPIHIVHYLDRFEIYNFMHDPCSKFSWQNVNDSFCNDNRIRTEINRNFTYLSDEMFAVSIIYLKRLQQRTNHRITWMAGKCDILSIVHLID